MSDHNTAVQAWEWVKQQARYLDELVSTFLYGGFIVIVTKVMADSEEIEGKFLGFENQDLIYAFFVISIVALLTNVVRVFLDPPEPPGDNLDKAAELARTTKSLVTAISRSGREELRKEREQLQQHLADLEATIEQLRSAKEESPSTGVVLADFFRNLSKTLDSLSDRLDRR